MILLETRQKKKYNDADSPIKWSLISNLELGLGLHCCLVHLDIVDSHPAEQGEGFNKVLVVRREGKLIKLQQLGFLNTFDFTLKFIIEKKLRFFF